MVNKYSFFFNCLLCYRKLSLFKWKEEENVSKQIKSNQVKMCKSPSWYWMFNKNREWIFNSQWNEIGCPSRLCQSVLCSIGHWSNKAATESRNVLLFLTSRLTKKAIFMWYIILYLFILNFLHLRPALGNELIFDVLGKSTKCQDG